MPFTIPNAVDAAFTDQAELHSRDIDILTLAYGGVGVLSGCAVTAQGTPDNTVAVAAGSIVTDGSQVSVTAGNVTMTAADGTNPRLDLVYVTSAGVKTYLAGTASTNPTPPAIPAGGVSLAFIYVAASDNVINPNQIVDKRIIIRQRSGPALIVAASNSLPQIRAIADYVCPGSADQTTINAALTAAGSTTVILAQGSYATSGAIVVGSSQHLWMHPFAAITRSGTGNGIECIGTSGAHKVNPRIEGGRLTGPSVSGTQIAGAGVYLEWVDRGHVNDLYASGFGSGSNDAGIQLLDTTACEIDGCELTNSKNGVCTGQPSSTTIRDTSARIQNNMCYSNFDDGIHLQRGANNLVNGNICWSHPNGGASDGAGIDTLGDEGTTVTGNVCFSNDRGLEVGNTANGSFPDKGVVLTGNVAQSNASYGITAIGASDHCRIADNIVRANGIDGIRVGTITSTTPINDLSVTENEVHDQASGKGIDIFGYVNRPKVMGNRCSGNATNDCHVRVSTGTPSDYYIVWNDFQSTTKLVDAVNDPDAWTYPNIGVSTNPALGGISFVLQDGASALTAGIKGEGIRVPFACTVIGWVIEGNVSGSIVVDVDRAAAGSTSYSSIAGTEKPTLSSAQLATDTALTTWTTALVEGDKLRFEAEATPATVVRVTVSLILRRT